MTQPDNNEALFNLNKESSRYQTLWQLHDSLFHFLQSLSIQPFLLNLTFRLLAIFHTELLNKHSNLNMFALIYLITLYTYWHLITLHSHSPGHKLYLRYSQTDQVANSPINTVRNKQVD